jgi:(1->4)-alpha-D-glucan 1-alpha-D-glucosylmutase
MAPLRATYRLQFNRDFTFRDALELVPYLAQLGISHIYASLVMEARPGSTHGYDIVNHNRLNPEIGSENDFRVLVAALRERGMGLVLDIVPNHMGVGPGNAWWLDVLEWGESSPYAHYFDIDWDAPRPDLNGRVLLPVLGDQYGTIVEAGEIELRFDASDGSFSFWYFEHRFPVAPPAYGRILLASGSSALATLAGEFSALKRARAGPEREAAPPPQCRLATATQEIDVPDALTTANPP